MGSSTDRSMSYEEWCSYVEAKEIFHLMHSNNPKPDFVFEARAKHLPL